MKLKFWKKEEEHIALVGASAKLAAAERMRQQDRLKKEVGDNSDAFGQCYSQTVPFTAGFIVAALIAIMNMGGGIIDLTGLSLTGSRSFDGFLFGTDVPYILGNNDVDQILVIFIRAFLYCLIAAVIPGIGYGLAQIGNKGQVSPYTACWGAMLLSPFVYWVLTSFIVPIFNGF